jgi:hypothetical protein
MGAPHMRYSSQAVWRLYRVMHDMPSCVGAQPRATPAVYLLVLFSAKKLERWRPLYGSSWLWQRNDECVISHLERPRPRS